MSKSLPVEVNISACNLTIESYLSVEGKKFKAWNHGYTVSLSDVNP